MELRKEEVIAVFTEKDGLVCNKCATDRDWAGVAEKTKLFTEENLKASDSLYFCDKCDTRLQA